MIMHILPLAPESMQCIQIKINVCCTILWLKKKLNVSQVDSMIEKVRAGCIFSDI